MKTPRALLLEDISKVTYFHRMTVADIQTKSRRKPIVRCRNEVFYFLRKRYHMTFPQIGRLFDCNHTTVIHGIGRHLQLHRINDPELNHLVAKVENRVRRYRERWHEPARAAA